MVIIHVFLSAKMSLFHQFNFTTIVLWPLNLRIPSIRQFPHLCETVSTASDLLSFRFHQIVDDRSNRRLSRWERAVRLFWHELFLPLGRSRSRPGSSSVADVDDIRVTATPPNFTRRSFVNALDASMIEGLLYASV